MHAGDAQAAGRGANGARPRRRTLLLSLCSIVVLLAALAGAASASAFSAHGSVEQLYVTGLEPGAQMTLLGKKGETVATQTADSLGGLLFRNVAPGKGYRVRLTANNEESEPITVHTQAPPAWDKSIYQQSIPSSGYTYLTTRDGTQLAIDVHPPGVSGLSSSSDLRNSAFSTASKSGQVPTLIEYAGYGYANPNGPESGIATLANLMGFAVVDVNMRGTGCSGGAFDYFEPLEDLDAYDVIQTIARQPWVLHHKVGMLGISYGGISQLFAAQLKPPALDAIAPLSVLDATATTLYPGGVLNTGFAVQWAEQRQFDAEPAGPSTGEHWAYEQIEKGDTTCAANQDMHGEATNLLSEIKENATYKPSVADALDPITFVHNIDVPTFMACQWEDEQTGGHCADLAEHMTGTEKKWFTFTNGVHGDSLDPDTINRLYDFLELYVARQAPKTHSEILDAAAPTIYHAALGVPKEDQVTLPPDPIQEIKTYGKALSAFDAIPEVRVLFDNGAGTSPTGNKTRRQPVPGLRTDLLLVPGPGHHGRVLVPRAGRRTRRIASCVLGLRQLHIRRDRDAADRLRQQHRSRRRVGRRLPVGMEMERAVEHQLRVLRDRAAQRRHHRDRRRGRQPLGEVLHAGRRPAGNGQRGAPGRQRRVRSERLHPRQRAQARDDVGKHVQAGTDGARADPDLPRVRRAADAGRRIRAGHGPAVLRGPRLPGGLADPRHDRRTERQPAGVVVQPDAAGRHDVPGVDRVRSRNGLEPDAAGGARPERADGPAGRLPEPAQRALPDLPGTRQQRVLISRRAGRRRQLPGGGAG